MEPYDKRLKRHLATYKQTHLGVAENGIWKQNQIAYSHILPEGLQHLNILETIRTEFWAFKHSKPEVKLHSDFNHLNSSQAMCFNLFFPYLGLPECYANHLLHAVGLPIETLQRWSFEQIPDKYEGTNFDLSLEFKSGARVLLEIKLSESGFGRAKYDSSHKKKFEAIYRPRLEGKISPDYLEPTTFFKHYQLLRNVAYANGNTRSRIIFLYPRANTELEAEKNFLDRVLESETQAVVSVVYLEDVLERLRVESAHTIALVPVHLTLFEEKYVLPG